MPACRVRGVELDAGLLDVGRSDEVEAGLPVTCNGCLLSRQVCRDVRSAACAGASSAAPMSVQDWKDVRWGEPRAELEGHKLRSGPGRRSPWFSSSVAAGRRQPTLARVSRDSGIAKWRCCDALLPLDHLFGQRARYPTAALG